MSSSIETLVNREYQYGFVTDVETDTLPPGLSEDVVRLISAQEERAGVAARLAAQGVPPLADDEGAALAERAVRPDRLPGAVSYYSAPQVGEAAPVAGRGRPRAAARRTRSSASRSTSRSSSPAWPSTRSSTRCRVGTTMKDGAREARDHLLLVRRSGAGASRARAEVPRLRRAVQRQLLRGAERGRLLRRLVRVHPEGRALPDGALHVLPHQRRGHRPVRAHADRRRRGLVRELPRGVHGAQARRRTSCTRRSSSSSRSRTRRSSTRPCRTGTRATRRAWAASTTS